MSESPVIRLVDVHKGFSGVDVLNGVSLDVSKGSSSVVMGGSGSGKSVLIKHIVGLLKPDKGEVWVNDRRVDELRGETRWTSVRLSIGYLFQSGALFDSMTCP